MASASGVAGSLLDLNPIAAFTRGLGITSGGGGITDVGVTRRDMLRVRPVQLSDSQEVRLQRIRQRFPGSVEATEALDFNTILYRLYLRKPAAYAFARLRFPGQIAAFLAIILSRLVPAVALVVPFYLLIQAEFVEGFGALAELVPAVQNQAPPLRCLRGGG